MTNVKHTAAMHEAIKLDEIAWRGLKLVGTQVIPADAYGPRCVLELRDCGCGSTLAREVKP